jgi:probable F420-dependent oxidoreductase
MVDICVGLWGAQELVGGDFAAVMDLVRLADEKGVDQIDIPDHVIMANPEQYIYGKFAVPVDYPWYEPMVASGAIAAVTKRARLTQGIMVGALRPAAVLAKQITTIDVLSHGRVDVGIGAGWMPEEFAACGVQFEKRFDYLFEMVAAMRALWSGAPASFHGNRIHFDSVWQLPLPVQPRIPVIFGLTVPSERNFSRIAELGDGWYPLEEEPVELGRQIGALKAAFEARGRNPDGIKIRATSRPYYVAEGRGDLAASLAKGPALIKAGVTILGFPARAYCRSIDDFEPFLDRILSLKA